MVTKIPDGILEKLYCDDCYKFLSVNPVKIFPGKRIKCGRCSNKGECGGVVSLYELIADQYYFPCLNRYDGCGIFLASSQVASHEENCKSGHYMCPICEDDERIPTFLMMKHYRERHRGALLKTPIFSVDPSESLRVEKWFLYKLENILFFIKYFLNKSDYTVALNASYIGVRNQFEKLTQKFILHDGSNRTPTKETLCLAIGQENTIGLSVSMSSFEQKKPITVCFEINISGLLLPKIHCLNKQAQYDFESVPAQQASVPEQISNSDVTRNDASLIEFDSCHSEDDLMKPRVVFLPGCFQDRFLVGSTFDCCVDKYNKKEVFFRCFRCEELKYSIPVSFPVSFVDTLEKNGNTYLKCDACSICTKALGLPNSELFESDVLLLLNRFKKLSFFCIWNCNMHVPIDDVFAHEIACDMQPSRLCPVESCSMKGKLSEIKTHFEEHNPEYSLSFDSEVVVQLSPSESPVRLFLIVRNNVFVSVELTWTERLWQMKFMLCGGKDTFAGMKLKVMVFDFNRENPFLSLLEQPQVMLFQHVERMKIKCFLEK